MNARSRRQNRQKTFGRAFYRRGWDPIEHNEAAARRKVRRLIARYLDVPRGSDYDVSAYVNAGRRMVEAAEELEATFAHIAEVFTQTARDLGLLPWQSAIVADVAPAGPTPEAATS